MHKKNNRIMFSLYSMGYGCYPLANSLDFNNMAATCRCLARSMTRVLRTTSAIKLDQSLPLLRKRHIEVRCLTNLCRQYSVATATSDSSVETKFSTGSLDEFMKYLDEKRDVYLLGVPFQATVEDIKQFFEGLNIKEVCFIDASKSRFKKICFVRFKDEGHKQKALELNKKSMNERYVEVCNIKEGQRLGYNFLRQNSSFVKLRNLPFEATKKDVIEWLKPVSVAEADVVFISRGKCIVNLKSSANVDEAIKKDNDKISDRPVRIEAFIPREALENFKKKYAT